MKTNNTKKALVLSTLALLLCVSMLVGTTFAWFTDSVSSVNNKIVSGNLDVELYWSTDAENWNTVDANTDVFTGELWEPGHTEVVYLKVVNEGTLALKYQLGVNIASEKGGINVDGEPFKLSEYIMFGVKDLVAANDAYTAYASREAAIDAVKDSSKLIANAYSKSNSLESKKEDVVALVVYMPTTVGNEANYKTGTNPPEINLGINLFATQYTYEEDSFGNNYDKDAAWTGAVDTTWYNTTDTEFTLVTAEQLAGLAAIVNDKTDAFTGKTIKLGADIDLRNAAWTPIGVSGAAFNGTFIGTGYTISNLYVVGGSGVGLFGHTGTGTHLEGITVDGAYVSGNDYVGTILGTGYLSANCIKNCTVTDATVVATPFKLANGNYDGGAKAGAIAGYARNGNITGNTVKNSTVIAYRDLGGIVGMAQGEDRPITVSGNKVENVTLSYVGVAGAYDGNKVNGNMNAVSGRLSNATEADDNEATNVTMNEANKGATMIYTLEELIAFAKDVNAGNDYKGKTVILGADIDLLNMEWTPIGTSSNAFMGTFDGNGKTISNLKITGSLNNSGFFGYANMATIKNLTIENAHVSGADCVGAIAGQVYSSSTVTKCNVTGEIQILGYTNVGGIVGKYYTKVTDCSVIGAADKTNFVKGVYLESDLEGDNVGGIMGHCGENNNLTGNTVKNITVSGTHKVGGIIGIADQNTEVNNCVVENVVVETIATNDYAASKLSTMSISALIGQYQAAGGNPDGTVTGNTIKNVSFANANNVTVSIGALTGGARGGSNGMIAPSDAIKVAGNVIENVTGTNNIYLFGAAVNGVNYQNALDAIAAAPSGTTITLLRSESNDAPIVIEEGKKLTIDLNGKNITGSIAKDAGAILVNNGTLTLIGGTLENEAVNGDYVINNAGELTLDDVTIVGASISTESGYPAYAVVSSGDLTIEEGTIISSDRGTLKLCGAGTTVINGGSFTANNIDRTLTSHVVYIEDGSTNQLTINGGTFQHLDPETSGGVVINNWSKGTVYVNGGNFSGGNYWSESNLSTYGFGGSFVVTGGTFTHFKDDYLASGYKATKVGEKYVVTADNTDAVDAVTDLKTALDNGQNIVLMGDITVAKSDVGSNAYGATGINILKGQTFDGNGNDFGVNAWGTWDSAISITSGTIKNVTINKGMRGIFINHNSNEFGKVYLENVIIDGTVYTISCDQGTNSGLEAKNCTFNGWTSYAATLGAATFIDCSFGEGQGYAFCRPYSATTFVGCDFEAGFEMDAVAAVTFENCTIGGVALTAENLSTLVTSNIANATVIE